MPSGVYKHHSHQGLQKGHTTNKGVPRSETTKNKLSKVLNN